LNDIELMIDDKNTLP